MPSTPLYHSLNHRRDIRLLRITSKAREKPIEVSLEVSNLDSGVAYTALSYVWGSPTPPSRIICNGHDVSITGNLWRLLAQLQKQQQKDKDQETHLLWADALCINQQDNKEKSVQVNMMRDIYKQAANVVFWLGLEEEYDWAAVWLMEAFAVKYEIYSDLEPFRVKGLGDLGLPSDDWGWRGWASLLSRPWFRRIWIVQEFLNARRSVFMSGALVIPSDVLIWFALATGVCVAIREVVARHNADFHTTNDIVTRAYALGIDRQVRAKEQVEDTRIFDLWTRSQLLGATDPRDRVFALLSTQTAVGMDMVDYDKDEETVYREIASIALTIKVAQTDYHRTTPCNLPPSPFLKNHERASRFLACKTQTLHSSSLPSWVPDWRPVGFRYVPLTRYFPGTVWFNHEYSHATIHDKTLSISGRIVDRPRIIVDSMPYAEECQPPIPLGNSNNDGNTRSWFKRMLDWQIMCYLLAKTFGSPSTKRNLLSTFCRTMAFNALTNKSAAPDEEYIAGFKALHSRLVDGMLEAVKYSLTLPAVNTPGSQDRIYESVFETLSPGRKFAVTAKGDLAWVPVAAKLGDRVCFLAGCAVPFVVRFVGGSFELLGDCYLHSMMCDESIMLSLKPQLFEFR